MKKDSSKSVAGGSAKRGNEAEIKRVLITGIAGTGGSYLAEFILENHPQVEVHGIARWHSTAENNLDAIYDRVTVHEIDLMDLGSVLTVFQEIRPDAVFHLAGHANVRISFVTPSSVLSNNIISTSNLFEAIKLARLDPIVQLGSTSEVYGDVAPEEVPIREDAPLRPVSPYAVSKVAGDLLGWAYFVGYKMRVIRTRMFAYLNARRPDLFATSFAKQVALIERGLQKELLHGNLDSVRTLLDVRDAMRAYWEAIIYCRPGEVYNIGSTTPIKVGEVLERLISMSDVPVPTRCSQALLRPADVTLQIPCIDKFVKETGWKPLYSYEKSLETLLSYWRAEVDRVVKSSDSLEHARKSLKALN